MKKSILTALIFLAVPLVSHASIINTEMGYGSTGAQVVELQQFLINNGYLQGTATGNFYSLTQRAVEAFQSAQGISPTGYVGSLTRAAINANLANQNSSSTTNQTSSQTQQTQNSPCMQGYVYSPTTGCSQGLSSQSQNNQTVYSTIKEVNDQAAQEAINNETGYQICSQSYPNETWDGTYNNGKYNCVCDTGYVSNGTSCQLPQQPVTPTVSAACQQAEQDVQTAYNALTNFNQTNPLLQVSRADLGASAPISYGRGQLLANQSAAEQQGLASTYNAALEEEQIACQ